MHKSMFTAHRPHSYQVADVQVGDRLRVVVYEGDYFPEPDHEIIYLLDGQPVCRELVQGYRDRLSEIQENTQALIIELQAQEASKTLVEIRWKEGGFGKPM